MNKFGSFLSITSIVCLILYTAYHALHSDKGFVNLVNTRIKIEEAKVLLSKLKKQRLQLENKISLLQEDTLDSDLLDELARLHFGYIAKGEYIIVTPSISEHTKGLE